MLCAKKILALVLVLVLVAEQCYRTDAWWSSRRRRRRRCHVPHKGHIPWVNDWDASFSFSCSYGKSIDQIRSLYSSCHRDRIWWFACRRNPVSSGRCNWSHYVNDMDALINFHCPFSGFITGIHSYNSNHHEDRRFKFRCCHRHHYKRYHCINSRYINGWRSAFHFRVPYGYYLSAATSSHNNGQGDRRWQFEYCKVKRYRGK